MLSSPKLAKSVLWASFLFAVFIAAVQVARNRTFWLDEAMVFDSLKNLSPWQILSGGPLHYGQMFPRPYLSLLALIGALTDYSRHTMRLIPMVFGLSGFYVWLRFFYEMLWIKERRFFLFALAAGLLVCSTQPHYYANELKSYSADFFFSGMLMYLYHHKTLSETWRIRLLMICGVVGIFFSYTTIFVVGSLLTVTAFSLLKNGKSDWRGFFGCLILFVGCCSLMYGMDYRYGLQGGMGPVLKEYWQDSFVTGNNASGLWSSWWHHYEHFLMDWWRTDLGPVGDWLLPDAARRFLLPGAPFNHPDIRNFMWLGSLYVMVREWIRASRWERFESTPLLTASVLIFLLSVLAIARAYPWGQSRLTLFAMPVAIVLITNVVKSLSDSLPRFRFSNVISLAFGLILSWQVFRNALYTTTAYVASPYREDIDSAMAKLDVGVSPNLVVQKWSGVIVRANSQILEKFNVLYEDDMPIPDIDSALKNKPFYYVWIHQNHVVGGETIPAALVKHFAVRPVAGSEMLGYSVYSVAPTLENPRSYSL